jgi:predicted transposase YbfD/YdcC
MPPSLIATLETHFTSLHDPRADHSIDHKLNDIVAITICAVICGADSWIEVENYGTSKQQWLSSFLELPKGIPSHDTFERLFARLRPTELQQCFLNWVQAIFHVTEGQVIAVDGKTLRGAYERGQGRSMIHMVSAWATANRIVLGQCKTQEKSNEITAIPELLKLLDLAGAVVTIDAMGTQKAIAQQIVDQGADYVLALKGNQGNLHQDVMQLFDAAFAQSFTGIEHQFHQTHDQAHGRIETRRYWVMGQTQYLTDSGLWAGLSSIGCVESKRTVAGKTSIERRFYILSFPPDVARFAQAVRAHWGIENQLHWMLDVGFREDHLRSCQGHSAENMAVIRHLALNLLSQDKTKKGGIHAKRLAAGWDADYLEKILTQQQSHSTI